MVSERTWRELHRTNDPDEVVLIRTTLASMEFDVRIMDGRGWLISDLAPGNDALPYVLQVPAEYAPDLADVLDEIISEQREFDAAMDAAESRAAVWKRRLLVAFIGVVGILAALRYIDL